MPSQKESPVKRFSGHVVLPDYLNIRQVRLFQDAFFGDPNEATAQADDNRKVYLSVNDEKVLPVLLQIVLEWRLKGVPEQPTVETFPGTPPKASHEVIDWLTREVLKLYQGETEIPNA